MPRPQRLRKPGRPPGSHRCILSLEACRSTAPLLPPPPPPPPPRLSFFQPHDGGGGPHSSHFWPRPQRQAQPQCPRCPDLGIETRGWTELGGARQQAGWSQGKHAGNGYGPGRARGVASGGVESGSPEPGNFLGFPPTSFLGRLGVPPSLAPQFNSRTDRLSGRT